MTWVPPGQPFAVDGRTIAGGLVFVGSGVPAVKRAVVEPCLIDPKLRVDWGSPDWAGGSSGYWPAYHAISPRARAAYLAWLNGERNQADAYIGYVFLFFYGLERRLLADLRDTPDHPDVAVIVAEVDRLLGVYEANYSFQRYATDLLNYVAGVRAIGTEVAPLAWNPGYMGWEVPLPVRIGVGRYVARGEPIPAEWALSYLRYHPERYLRTPAERCAAEFDELFVVRYNARFGDGMKVRPLARKITFSYRPASGGFGADVSMTAESIPDVVTAPSVIEKLKELGTECTDALDAYSRFVGRRPDEIDTAAAAALLPDEIFATRGGNVVRTLRDWTAALLAGEQMPIVSFDGLLNHYAPGRAETLAKRDAVGLSSMLAKIGVGIEPDVRFGGQVPKLGSLVVLFELPEGAPAAPSVAYNAAASLVRLTAVVAAADGVISNHEQQHLVAHAERVLGLDRAERLRIEAHLRFLSTGKVAMTGIKKHVDLLPQGDRADIGRFLIDVAASDGTVTPEEITTLTKLFAQLGLDESEVYRQVHAIGTSDSGPITVREAEAAVRWTVPEPVADASERPVVHLDPAKVKARIAETAHVSALLAGIFDDGAASFAPPEPGTAIALAPPGHVTPHAALGANGVPNVAGLDPAHSSLAIALAARAGWARSDAEDLAASLGLPLLNGALDRINEAAMDSCGDPLVEGEDPLELNSYAAKEMF